MRNLLISTAGTSLLSNIERDKDDQLKKLKDSRNIKVLCDELLKFDPDSKICGAEINSVASIIQKSMLEKRVCHLILVSDTDDGRLVGEILQKFYTSRKNRSSFEKAEYKVVEGLNANDAQIFQKQGLKNLVRIIGKAVREYGPEQILINATGGFKAQISFAGMIGQALDIPVCYMFENFSEVIELPPQPVSFDFNFWIENAALFYGLEDYMEFDSPQNIFDGKFSILVEGIEENGKYAYALTPAGHLFHETFRTRFKRRTEEFLPKESGLDDKKKKITYEDSNAGKHKGLSPWLENIKMVPFVNSIYTFYYHPDLNLKKSFTKDSKKNTDTIEGCFSGNGSTSRFILRTTAKTAAERDAAIAWLTELFVAD